MPYTDRQKQIEYKHKWNREHYKKHKRVEKHRIFKRRDEIVKWFNTLKARLHCFYCYERETVCLDFHHVDHKQKDFSLGMIRNGGYGKERILKEVKKCVVVCANCHRKVHAGLLRK